MSELTQQQINQKRRQKILARSRRLQTVQQKSVYANPKIEQANQQQNEPLLKNNLNSSNAKPNTQELYEQQRQQRDAFSRFRQMQAKIQRQKILILFSKVLGGIVAFVQFYLLTVLKKYQNKHKNHQFTDEVFEQIKQKLLDELDLVFWACFGLIAATWIWIKFVRSEGNPKQKFQIIPGSNMIGVLQQLNKVLEYKILVKALLGYAFACIVCQIICNQTISLLSCEQSFFKPNLVEILSQISLSPENQQIL